jgi:lactoylglutathione lyase
MNQPMILAHVIEYVADMDAAVKFYRDIIGFPLKFQSPGWSELDTGATCIALHPASDLKPAGTIEFGFNVDDLVTMHRQLLAKGVKFSMDPAKQDYGRMLAQFVDPDGAHATVSSSL